MLHGLTAADAGQKGVHTACVICADEIDGRGALSESINGMRQ